MTVQIAQGRIIALVGPEQLGVAVYNQAAQGKGSGLERHVPSRQAGGKLPLIAHILGTELLQAYIPQIAGKEKRKQKSGKEGLLGVEGMTPDVLVESLRRCGAHFLDDDAPLPAGGITRQDLYAWGLMGGEDSREKRELLKRHFGLPSHLGTGGFLDALNLIATREQVAAMMEQETTE